MASRPQQRIDSLGATGIEAELLESSRAALRAFVARRVNDPTEAEDLVQEACVRLIQAGRTHPVERPQAYLFRIAANLIADRGRRPAPTEPFDEALAPPVRAAQEDGRTLDDLQHLLDAALAELSPSCRRVFVMRRFEELSTADIARQLRITPRMVQKHLVHAVAHLYERLAALRTDG
ncbi:RNA polymerase sigma factor [Sphingomonas flavalba]|uniref:RNA polymerase sigma factor n=1 Tax=Sphingomonas flavalba TaxID=2559804 RepID=UPI0039E12331